MVKIVKSTPIVGGQFVSAKVWAGILINGHRYIYACGRRIHAVNAGLHLAHNCLFLNNICPGLSWNAPLSPESVPDLGSSTNSVFLPDSTTGLVRHLRPSIGLSIYLPLISEEGNQPQCGLTGAPAYLPLCSSEPYPSDGPATRTHRVPLARVAGVFR